MRENADVAVYVDLAEAARQGILFYRSKNDVILTQGLNGVLHPRFIISVWHIRRNDYIYHGVSALVPEVPTPVALPKAASDRTKSTMVPSLTQDPQQTTQFPLRERLSQRVLGMPARLPLACWAPVEA